MIIKFMSFLWDLYDIVLWEGREDKLVGKVSKNGCFLNEVGVFSQFNYISPCPSGLKPEVLLHRRLVSLSENSRRRFSS